MIIPGRFYIKSSNSNIKNHTKILDYKLQDQEHYNFLLIIVKWNSFLKKKSQFYSQIIHVQIFEKRQRNIKRKLSKLRDSFYFMEIYKKQINKSSQISERNQEEFFANIYSNQKIPFHYSNLQKQKNQLNGFIEKSVLFKLLLCF
ncbi:hypothetical protein TTHERM_000161709 (macronuclear) [Tetrahymena thermophila SB210]|uniref:Uncharacterized protein n=1 Tax=Tetrahymena thermophila (strain SB210) TaxID=312017 RepID=W7XE56_TETTS|nr:hypothetical protein TTHERM_000161709 [Tetrahymena thermophila SB210]EWS75947.1 hypothetical protein TTHERM_000161709 [Tetrahymena thermophila SB210]|eukprot:XP_012651465.1 hypothetical protein TTHERM_000161709 [Tetrahymena thermophila SB210]